MRIISTSTRATTVAVLALATATLGACGSDDKSGESASSSDYCQELETDKVYFESLNGGDADVSKLDTVFEKIHSLAAAAPSDIAGDWKVLDTAITAIEDALADAGLDAADLAALQKGTVPDGVDVNKLATLGPKLKALGGTEVNDAADHIAQNAKTACGVDLTRGLTRAARGRPGLYAGSADGCPGPEAGAPATRQPGWLMWASGPG